MDDEKRIRLEHDMYKIGLCVLGAGMMLSVIWMLLPHTLLAKLAKPCLFHAVTGLYCPGCGGTRAVMVLLKGKFAASFLYHPVVPYSVVVYLYFMITHTIEYASAGRVQMGMRYRNGYIWAVLALVLIHTAVKNIALIVFHLDFLKMLDGIYFQ